MNDIPLPVQRPPRVIDGRALVQAFLESGEPTLPTDPDEIAAFSEALNEAVMQAPDPRDLRNDTLRKAPDSIKAKSARLRGGRVGDGGVGGIVDDVADFVGGLPYDAGNAMAQAYEQGSIGKGLGALAMLAASAVPAGRAGVKSFRGAEEGSKVAYDAANLASLALPADSESAARILGQLRGQRGSLDAGITPSSSLRTGATLGAAGSAGTIAAQGETDPVALLTAGATGAALGAAGDRIGGQAGHRFGLEENKGFHATGEIARQDMASARDLVNARIPTVERQLSENLALEERLQKQDVGARHKAQALQQKQRSSRLLEDQSLEGSRNTASRAPAAPQQANMLSRLNAGDFGQIQAPQTYGDVSQFVSYDLSSLADIGAEAAKTKATRTISTPPSRIRSGGAVLNDLKPGSAFMKDVKSKLKSAGLGSAKARKDDPVGFRKVVFKIAKESGMQPKQIREAVQRKEKR